MSDLHVLQWGGAFTGSSTLPTFGLYLTTRSSGTGEWTTFEDVFGKTGYPTDSQGKWIQLGNYTCAVDSEKGDLHVCAVDTHGAVWHTIRKSSGTWSKWGNATKAAHFHQLLWGGVAVAS